MIWPFNGKQSAPETTGQLLAAMQESRKARVDLEDERRSEAEDDLVESAYEYRDAMTQLEGEVVWGDERMDLVARRRLAIQRAQRAVEALGFACSCLDSLRRWKRASGHSGVGVLYPKSMLERAFGGPIPEDV